MKRTRLLDNSEIRLVSACFDGIFEARNPGLFMLGVSTSGCISELLSLQIRDVYQNGRAVTALPYSKSIVKGGEISRGVPVNRNGKQAVDDSRHIDYYSMTENDRLLFPAGNRQDEKRTLRRDAHDFYKETIACFVSFFSPIQPMLWVILL